VFDSAGSEWLNDNVSIELPQSIFPRGDISIRNCLKTSPDPEAFMFNVRQRHKKEMIIFRRVE
jgi:hypothetical protein